MNHIAYLADHPSHAEEIAQVRSAHWHHIAPERPYAVWISDVKYSARTGALPMTLVAVQDSALLGFVTLVEFGEKADIENGAWLITLYVKSEHRGAGLGRRLVERGQTEARNLGYSLLYLWTDSTHLTAYYARSGWRLLGQDNESGDDIMVYDLNRPTSYQ